VSVKYERISMKIDRNVRNKPLTKYKLAPFSVSQHGVYCVPKELFYSFRVW